MQQHLPSQKITMLAEKWMNGSISEAEMQEFNEWYNRFNDEELSLSADYTEEALRKRILDNVRERVTGEENPRTTSISRYRWVAAAALIGVIALSGYLTNWWGIDDGIKSVKTIAGQRSKIILPDSTIVWLKPNSNLLYSKEFTGTTRMVELQGEALFEVAKNKDRPFIIKAGEYTTKVLGTSFNIRNTTNQPFELTVFTGKVMVEKKLADGSNQQTVIIPQQRVKELSEKLVLKAYMPEEKENYAAGTEYDMGFRNTPFTAIVERIEKKFNVKCIIENNLLKNCRLTADLTDQSLHHSLELIAASIDLSYQIKEGEVRLSGNGCE